MKTLLLGLGNDLRGNDAVGLHVIDHIRSMNIESSHVRIERTLASGIHLLSYFPGYERIFIVDSVQVADADIGQFWRVSPEELKRCRFSTRITHGIGIHSILDIVRKIGFENPREVVLFLVGIKKMDDYFYECRDDIDHALKLMVPRFSEEIVKSIHATHH
ncbi:MAG: hydrogenase maturation protease [Candidatus Omnitrophota bacterium]